MKGTEGQGTEGTERKRGMSEIESERNGVTRTRGEEEVYGTVLRKPKNRGGMCTCICAYARAKWRSAGGRRGEGEEREKERRREWYSTLYREISIMRICNFNASPSPGKLPKHNHPQTFVPIRSLALPYPYPTFLPSHSQPLLLHPPPPPPPPPPPLLLLLLLLSLLLLLALLPLYRLLWNAITPRATPYVQRPDPPTSTCICTLRFLRACYSPDSLPRLWIRTFSAFVRGHRGDPTIATASRFSSRERLSQIGT